MRGVRTGLVVIKEAESLDGLLLWVTIMHLARHDSLKRLKRDGARTFAVGLGDHAAHLLTLGLEAHRAHRYFELCTIERSTTPTVHNSQIKKGVSVRRAVHALTHRQSRWCHCRLCQRA